MCVVSEFLIFCYSEDMERQHLIAYNKLDYVRGKRPKVDCILCAVRDQHPEVQNLEVFRDKDFLATVNLYPYNLGHLMLVPLRHIESPDELTEDEALGMHRLQARTLAVLRSLYHPGGFNIGYNIGETGGGSIDHLHMHIVPRFRNELGFIGTIGNTQVMVEDPKTMMERIKQAFEA